MIKEKFLDTIKEYNMFDKGDLVLVAVSGGADSTALIHLLAEFKDKLGIELHIAHLNHMIRKNDAELDMRFVQGLAQKLDIPITVESFEVQHYAKEEKIGLEDAARRIRYAFYERTANQLGAKKIAVGHTADDNVETFLMRILRGAGLKGLCGIPPKRGWFVRPAIKLWRKEIENYVGSLKLVPRRDYTNYESKFTRNRVRLKLIPQLRIYNMNIKEIILQTILLLTEDRNYIDTMAEEALGEVFVSASENDLRIDIEKLTEWETPMQGHVVRLAIERVRGNLLDISYRHVREILEKLESDERWELHLPGGIYALGNRGELVISREKPQIKEKKKFFYTFTVPGEVEVVELGKKVRASVVEADLELVDDPKIVHVDYFALGKNLIVRNRSEGDKFIPLGMKGSKKLQDFFVDEKIPAEFRDYVPIIESAGKIVWVGGHRIDDRAKVTKKTKKTVKLELI